MSIKSINSTNEGLEIFWSDSNVSCFPWFWLRDHSESSVDLHPDTKQRQIDSFSEPLDNTVNKVWLDENARNLYVKWEDQSESCLSYGLLKCMATPASPQSNALQSSDLWNSPSEKSHPLAQPLEHPLVQPPALKTGCFYKSDQAVPRMIR